MNYSLETIRKFTGLLTKVSLGFASSYDQLHQSSNVLLISDGDYMRLATPSGNQEPRCNPELKRKAWLVAFLGPALFWVIVALLIWKLWG